MTRTERGTVPEDPGAGDPAGAESSATGSAATGSPAVHQAGRAERATADRRRTRKRASTRAAGRAVGDLPGTEGASHASAAAGTRSTASASGTAGTAVGAALLLAVPVALAVLGPLAAPAVTPHDGAPYVMGHGHLLGTDRLGRDVLGLLLRGGRSALGVACGAVALAYLAGGALGLGAAATRHRLLDELLLRPVEVLLPVPSLLVISVVGVGWRGQPVAIALAVAAINVPAVARLVRAAALDAASGPVAEAMRMQGESFARVHFGYVGRRVLPVAAADVGTRVANAVFTVAAANFLGLGMDPASPDWGVSIAGSREALFVQPWSVGAPAAMLVAFTVGLNLLADRLLARRSRTPAAKEAAACDR